MAGSRPLPGMAKEDIFVSLVHAEYELEHFNPRQVFVLDALHREALRSCTYSVVVVEVASNLGGIRRASTI